MSTRMTPPPGVFRLANHRTVYIPRSLYTSEQGAITVVLFLHGGAFVLGHRDTYEFWLSNIANRAQVVVVASDYRLAPEHRYPSAWDDAEAGLDWIIESLAKSPCFPRNVASFRVCVMGESAGGALAASLAHKRRREISFGLYICPILNLASFSTPSWRTLGKGGWMLRRNISDMYLSTRENPFLFDDPAQAREKRASPVLEDDWTGVPATHILAGGWDPLRDDARLYVDAARRSGRLDITLTVYDSATHGFCFYPNPSRESMEAVEEIISSLTLVARENALASTNLSSKLFIAQRDE